MYYKINPTGCSEKKGMVQVRYDLYLDPTDERYAEHHIQIPVIPPGGYPGQMNGPVPADPVAYKAWLDGLPKEWQDNPFCCHFCQFDPTVKDKDLEDFGTAILLKAYDKWKIDKLNEVKNDPIAFPSTVDDKRKSDCEKRITEIKTKYKDE
jgi:hypothetical protein